MIMRGGMRRRQGRAQPLQSAVTQTFEQTRSSLQDLSRAQGVQ